MHAVKNRIRLTPKTAFLLLLLVAGLVAWLLSSIGKPEQQETNPQQDEPQGVQELNGTPDVTSEELDQEIPVEPTLEPFPTPSPRPLDPDKPMVALTFDDGPSGKYSGRILDCLEENNAVATFFEIGCNVDEYPEITKRAAEQGCEIGSHTYYHKVLPGQSAEAIQEDQRLCREAFENAMDASPKLIRPPEGSVVHSVMDMYDQVFIGWSVDTEDWLYRSVDWTVNKVKQFGNLEGQVILMHSIYEESAEAAEQIIPWLIEQGYQLVTVSELLVYHYGIIPEYHYYYAYDYFISDGQVMVS